MLNPEEIMNRVEGREELQESIEKLEDKLKENLQDDLGTYLLRKTYNQNRMTDKLSDLMEKGLVYTSPGTGEEKTLPLKGALEGEGITSDEYYLRRKLREAIQEAWDDVSRYL